jgi:ring-1,2-phenylacetyl-CoA epoxidase subunit PaaC
MTKRTADLYKEFLVAWADDELMVGHHISDRLKLFCVPTIEEYLALASIGQDEMGHAQQVMGLFIEDARERERYVYERRPSEFRACQLARLGPEVNGDWARVVARGWVYDSFELARIRSLISLAPSWVPLDLLGLMEREEREHLQHWEVWIRLLAETGEGHGRLEDALEFLAPFLGDFALPGDSGPVRLALDECLSQARRVLDDCGIKAPGFRQALGRRGPAQEVPSFAATVSAMQAAYRVEPGNIWG